MISKKKLGIIGIVAVIVVVLAFALIPSKFDRVQRKCVEITGFVATTNEKEYFTIETVPEIWNDMTPEARSIMASGYQQKALNAIKFANEELGFPGIYSQMMNTTALMGRQSEENSKYKVTWTYHPDDGLKVTYTKKH